MKKKDISDYITQISLISTIINLMVMIILGVKSDYTYNYITTSVCCSIASLVASIIFTLKIKDINIIKLLILLLVNIVLSFVIGYFFEYLIIDKLFKINNCSIEKLVAVLYKSLFGIFTGIIISYINYSMLIKKEM